MKKVAVVGVYPPPYGGISVHIERLAATLEKENIPYVVYDESKQQENKSGQIVPIDNVESWCRSYLFQKNEDVIHNHFLRWQVRFLLSLLRLKGKKVIHTLHSMRGESYSPVHKVMIYLTGKLSNHFIVVNDEIKEKLIQLGIAERKISVIPAFIPPVEDSMVEIPAYIEDFFAAHKQVIVANGGVGNLYKGKELYGLDLCVDMFIKLANEKPDAACIYCITHVDDEKVEQEMKEKLEAHGVADRFLFVYEKMPMYPLMKKAALFVRPTRSDGDAISIREALHYKIPVVTSDVANRPDGVALFENDSVESFTEVCLTQLSMDGSREETANLEQDQYVTQVINILKS